MLGMCTQKNRIKPWVHVLGCLVVGLIIGLLAKWLDHIPSNALPYWIESLDLRNFFSRLAVWMFMAIVITMQSSSSKKAALHVFMFLIGALSAYYAYTILILGFMPRQVMIFWFTIAFVSPVLALIVWHAKTQSWLARMLSAFILTLFARQVLAFGLWYIDIVDYLEFVLLIGLGVFLYQSKDQFIQVVVLSIGMFIVLMPLGLIFGMF
jgi:hypothetical protein